MAGPKSPLCFLMVFSLGAGRFIESGFAFMQIWSLLIMFLLCKFIESCPGTDLLFCQLHPQSCSQIFASVGWGFVCLFYYPAPPPPTVKEGKQGRGREGFMKFKSTLTIYAVLWAQFLLRLRMGHWSVHSPSPSRQSMEFAEKKMPLLWIWTPGGSGDSFLEKSMFLMIVIGPFSKSLGLTSVWIAVWPENASCIE